MKWECFFCGKEMQVVEGEDSIAGACGHCEVQFTAKEGPLKEFMKSLATDEEAEDVKRNRYH